MQYLPFTLLLLAALILSMSLAHLQHRYYIRTVNRLAAECRQSGYVLCSGIARGRLRGAIAILVVRRDGALVERAVVMEGSSILARFRELSALCGQPLDALERASLSNAAKRALRDAATRFQQRFVISDGVEGTIPSTLSTPACAPAPGSPVPFPPTHSTGVAHL